MGNQPTTDEIIQDETTDDTPTSSNQNKSNQNNQSNSQSNNGNERGKWFTATTDFNTGVTNLKPSGCDESHIEYIFTRLYCEHNNFKQSQPKVNTDLIKERFDSLRKANLTHLLSNHELIPNLRDFDSHLGECEKLKKEIKEQTLALRNAYKNPRINLLHRICRNIIQISKKNATTTNYMNLDSLVIYGSVVLAVVSQAKDEFIAGTMDKNGSYRMFRRSLSNNYDLVDAVRTHEYAVTARAQITKQKNMLFDANRSSLNETEKRNQMSASKSQLTVCLDQEDLQFVEKSKYTVKEMPTSGEKKPRLVENGIDYGRGKIITYHELVKQGGSVETIIVPLTKKKWKIGQIFNLIRKASNRIVLVEVSRGAISHLTSSEVKDEGNVNVFSTNE